jgi:hypothetical protein
LLLVIAAEAIGGGFLFCARMNFATEAGWHMPALAAAVHVYYNTYHDLPSTLATMEATGLYAPTAYRPPASEWELMFSENRSGPRPFYAPIHGWDGSTTFIVAVGGKMDRLGWQGRRYVILGDTAAHSASEQELARLLAEDDARRAKAGQAVRWSQVGWARN